MAQFSQNEHRLSNKRKQVRLKGGLDYSLPVGDRDDYEETKESYVPSVYGTVIKHNTIEKE